MCVCHITRWLVVIWLIVSLVHLQANALLQYSAAELLKLRHHVPAPLQPPERGHDIPPGIAFQPRRRYVHRGSRQVQKRNNDDKVARMMDKTFALRREEVVREAPMIADFKTRWPALFHVREVSSEFKRITTHLQSKFFAELDAHSAKLLKVYA
uniref:Uncharacterized protein n=1 Tax=Knipowitschia caucasica TaxID=637954 RepID=A0AAV2J4P8_KNICA